MILYLTDPAPDYGADYLYDGFRCLFGDDRVLEWQPKMNLHLRPGAPRQFDCDAYWSVHPTDARMFVEDTLASTVGPGFDLIVVPTLRGEVASQLNRWHHAGLLGNHRNRIVYYDAEDQKGDTVEAFRQAAGAVPAVYFKRELPIGARWAKPLPFGYPAYRVTPVKGVARFGAVYAAHIWDWAKGGTREKLARLLMGNSQIKVNAPDRHSERLTIEDYHQQNRRAVAAISPAGFGSQTNRHLDIVADGCCPIIERLTVEWPDFFIEGEECLMFSTPEEGLNAVNDALRNPEAAAVMAEKAQRKLIDKHSTMERARTVWGAVHG